MPYTINDLCTEYQSLRHEDANSKASLNDIEEKLDFINYYFKLKLQNKKYDPDNIIKIEDLKSKNIIIEKLKDKNPLDIREYRSYYTDIKPTSLGVNFYVDTLKFFIFDELTKKQREYLMSDHGIHSLATRILVLGLSSLSIPQLCKKLSLVVSENITMEALKEASCRAPTCGSKPPESTSTKDDNFINTVETSFFSYNTSEKTKPLELEIGSKYLSFSDFCTLINGSTKLLDYEIEKEVKEKFLNFPIINFLEQKLGVTCKFFIKMGLDTQTTLYRAKYLQLDRRPMKTNISYPGFNDVLKRKFTEDVLSEQKPESSAKRTKVSESKSCLFAPEAPEAHEAHEAHDDNAPNFN